MEDWSSGGSITIDPPIDWADIKDSPYVETESHLTGLTFVLDGERRAVHITARFPDCGDDDTAVEHLQDIVNRWPDRKYGDCLSMFYRGDDDVEVRINVMNGEATSHEPVILWPTLDGDPRELPEPAATALLTRTVDALRDSVYGTTSTPWTVDEETPTQVRGRDKAWVASARQWQHPAGAADGRYMASMDPRVGIALSNLLVAITHQEGLYGKSLVGDAARGLARTYLREAVDPTQPAEWVDDHERALQVATEGGVVE